MLSTGRKDENGGITRKTANDREKPQKAPTEAKREKTPKKSRRCMELRKLTLRTDRADRAGAPLGPAPHLCSLAKKCVHRVRACAKIPGPHQHHPHDLLRDACGLRACNCAQLRRRLLTRAHRRRHRRLQSAKLRSLQSHRQPALPHKIQRRRICGRHTVSAFSGERPAHRGPLCIFSSSSRINCSRTCAARVRSSSVISAACAGNAACVRGPCSASAPLFPV